MVTLLATGGATDMATDRVAGGVILTATVLTIADVASTVTPLVGDVAVTVTDLTTGGVTVIVVSDIRRVLSYSLIPFKVSSYSSVWEGNFCVIIVGSSIPIVNE
jgi:hypothetical protein